jgi:peptidoglycan/LPS O-acetylase OafA/YrhL
MQDQESGSLERRDSAADPVRLVGVEFSSNLKDYVPIEPAIDPASNASLSNQIRAPRRFYPQLDGLRAVAVFFVLLNHMGDLNLPAPLAYMSSLGWIGVDAFFVLSGFLITTILLTCRPEPRAFGLFVLRRTLRTWPLYFAVLLAAFATIRLDVAGTQINWLQHVFFLQNYSAQFVARSLGPTWSLCIEEHFYIVWPLFVFLLPRRVLVWVLPSIFVALPALRFWGLHHAFTYKQLYTETQFHLDGLTAGSFVALLVCWYSIRPRTILWTGYACLIAGIGTSLLGFWRSWNVLGGQNVVFGFTSLAVTFAGLLLFLLVGEKSVLGRIFSLGPVRYIGKISYGIYLLHDGIISLLGRLVKHGFWGAIAESWIFAIPLRIGITICIAALSYRFFESPILRIKDRLR